MNRQSVIAAITAVVLGTSLLLSGGAAPVAAQVCDGCSQSTGSGVGKLPPVELAEISATSA